jgi:hypothetical protein
MGRRRGPFRRRAHARCEKPGHESEAQKCRDETTAERHAVESTAAAAAAATIEVKTVSPG